MEENKDYSVNATDNPDTEPRVEDYESQFINTSTMEKTPVVNHKGMNLFASKKDDFKRMKMAYISNGLLLMLFGIVDFVIMHNLLKEMFPQFASLAILIFTMVLLGVVTLLQGLILKNEVKSKSFWLDKTYDISIDDSNELKVDTTLMPLGYLKSIFSKLSYGCLYGISCIAILTVATEPTVNMRVLGMALLVTVISCFIVINRMKEASRKLPYNKLKFYCEGYVLECTSKLRHWRKI